MTEQNRRMVRVPEGRLLAGVCTGLGAFTGIDPLIYRVAFALLALANGQGVLLYVAAVLLMPAGPDRHAVSDQVFRRRFEGGTVLAILGGLLGLAFLMNVTTAGMSKGGHGGPAGNALTSLTVLAVALLVAHARGVDLAGVARSMPERLHGLPLPPDRTRTPGVPEPWGPGSGRPVPPQDEPGAAQPAHGAPGGHGGHLAPAAAPGTGPSTDSNPGPGPGPGPGPVTLDKPVPGTSARPPGSGGGSLPEGMVDLAGYSTPPDRLPHAPGADGTRAAKAGAPTAGHPGRRERRSVLTPVTLLVALIATAALIPAATDVPSGLSGAQILMATALTTVALGLVVGSAIGRGRGLVAVGALLSVSLMATSIVGEVPVNGRYGDVEWRPVDASTTERNYRIIVGDGRLDLTGLPLTPGARVIVNAQFVLGELQVTLPRTARAELHLRVGLGDIMVDRRITSGPGAKVDRILSPDGSPAAGAPVIELHVRGRVGDLEVSRA